MLISGGVLIAKTGLGLVGNLEKRKEQCGLVDIVRCDHYPKNPGMIVGKLMTPIAPSYLHRNCCNRG